MPTSRAVDGLPETGDRPSGLSDAHLGWRRAARRRPWRPRAPA